MHLILASNSPRRKEILKNHGCDFSVIKSEYKETDGKTPVETAVNNAVGKAKDVYGGLTDKNEKIVLGADTVVCFNGEILGKPKDAADAVKTLTKLSGNTHEVVTGYAVVTERGVKSGYEVSKVTFNKLSESLIKEYVNSGLSLDKAGSYGIQDGYPIVKSYSGDLENIIGLPFYKIKRLIFAE